MAAGVELVFGLVTLVGVVAFAIFVIYFIVAPVGRDYTR
jgi:hypothetical protein